MIVPVSVGAMNYRRYRKAKDEQLGKRLIELRGVQRDAKRDSGELMRIRVGERYCPWQMALRAPAAARGRNSRAGRSHDRSPGRARRHPPSAARVIRCAACTRKAVSIARSNPPWIHAGCLQCLEGENLARMQQIRSPVEDEHEELRARHARDRAVDGKIRDLIRLAARASTPGVPVSQIATRNAIATSTP